MSVPGTPYSASSRLLRPPAGAVGLSAIRAVGPAGAMRQYSAVVFDRGWAGVDHFIRTLRAVGYAQPSTETGYAVLDVLDADGDIIGDYTIPTSRAFAFVKRKLGLTVESADAL